METAQALGLKFCEENFPGHPAIVCTHPDGHNHSGNIHVHIVIGSVRTREVERKPYMQKPRDWREGMKHSSTAQTMRHLRVEVMELCEGAGLYQIDLLNGSKERVSEAEYWARRRGQQKLDLANAALTAAGQQPQQRKFETVKDTLRKQISSVLYRATSFEDWLVDPEAAAIVKRIFSMCMEGRGPTQIANQLWADKVLTPTAYKLSHGRSTNAPAPEDPYRWDKRAVSLILERREYTGCTVNFKTYTNSIWDKKRHLNPVENQAIFLDTHERIIDDDVFEKVQEIRNQRHRMTRTGKSSIFSGMVYCADCGSKMQYGSSNNRDFSQDFFDCSLHKKNGSKCKGHFIRVKVLEGRVLSHVQRVTDYILRHEDYFRKVMEEQLRVESTEKLTVLKKQLARNEKRIADLKRLFMKIYEDNASGKLSDERFDMMSQSYDAEQKHLEEEALSIQQEIEVQEQQIENIEKFVQKAHKYVHIEELTPYALRELVSAIYVDAPDKSSGKRVQHIHIKYDGLGYIPLDELEAKEKA